jgi:hypothetical protein
LYFHLFIFGQKFSINRFIRNFLQPTYKKDMCPLNMWETHVFLLMVLKKHVRSTCYWNNMCFSHVKRYMSISYVGCRKFPTNPVCRKFLSFIFIFILILVAFFKCTWCFLSDHFAPYHTVVKLFLGFSCILGMASFNKIFTYRRKKNSFLYLMVDVELILNAIWKKKVS